MFDWLDELLYRFEVGRRLFSEFQIAFSGNRLSGTARGEKIDTRRHQLQHEIKANTYHELKVWQEGGRWYARVIVDI